MILLVRQALANARGLPIATTTLLQERRGDDALEMVLATASDVLFCTPTDVDAQSERRATRRRAGSEQVS